MPTAARGETICAVKAVVLPESQQRAVGRRPSRCLLVVEQGRCGRSFHPVERGTLPFM